MRTHNTTAGMPNYSCMEESCPPSILRQVAAAACVSPHALSCVTVENKGSYEALFSALVTYGEMFARERDDKTPLRVGEMEYDDYNDCTSNSDESSETSSDSSVSDSDSDSSDSSEDSDDSDEGLRNVPGDEFEKMEQARREKLRERLRDYVNKQRSYNVLHPSLELGFGQTMVLWPPTPSLSARALAKQELDNLIDKDFDNIRRYVLMPDFEEESQVERRQKQKKKHKKNKGEKASEEKRSETPATSGSQNDGTHAEGEEHSTNGVPNNAEKAGAKDSPTNGDGTDIQGGEGSSKYGVVAEQTPNDHAVIYLAMYEVGEVKASEGELLPDRRVTVLSAAPMSTLRRFLDGVVKWNFERHPLKLPSPRSRKHLCLSRFKLEGDDKGYWETESDRRSRPASSVILPEGQMDDILEDVGSFLTKDTKAWYDLHGLPQRRSFLFYGPPGTGKTSTIRVIASEFGRQCCFLSMANDKFSNQALADALESLPDDPLLVIEDVDALFTNRKSDLKSLTFSGLLNALDGVLSVDGVVTMMTTNHIERLDEGLLRAGRIDRRFFFGRPDYDCIRRLFLAFYPTASEETSKKFADHVWSIEDEKTARSIATLQQLFIMKRSTGAEECADSVSEFFETYFPKGVDIRKKLLDEAEEQKRKLRELEENEEEDESDSDSDDNEKEGEDDQDDDGEKVGNDDDDKQTDGE